MNGFVKSKEVTEGEERFGEVSGVLEILYFLLWVGFVV